MWGGNFEWNITTIHFDCSFQATSNASEMKRLQAGDIDYKEAMAASAIRNKFEVDGIKAEQNATVLKVGHTFTPYFSFFLIQFKRND